jgi:nucleotide-binding universal stress UspA family protein
VTGALIAEKYKVKSLLEPEITVTTPLGTHRSNRTVIRPHTAYDDEASGFNTPVDSDTEADLSDIKRAQDLKLRLTPIVSTPITKRCVQTLLRGDFDWVQKEADENHRRVRKYIVATDLSEESHHALQWTVGTVLRDGDTLLMIYCVDEEVGIHSTDGSADDQIIKGQVAAIAKPMTSTPVLTATAAPTHSPLGSTFRRDNAASSASPMGRGKNKAEHERYKAVENITERVSKLLRKTKLQVKVVVEVVHCKDPSRLLLEVVDYLNPTLVILGSRGRSALKR